MFQKYRRVEKRQNLSTFGRAKEAGGYEKQVKRFVLKKLLYKYSSSCAFNMECLKDTTLLQV